MHVEEKLKLTNLRTYVVKTDPPNAGGLFWFFVKVNFFKLNTDENPQVASQFGIRSIPTLLVFKGGEAVGQIVGFRPKGDLQKRLDEALV